MSEARTAILNRLRVDRASPLTDTKQSPSAGPKPVLDPDLMKYFQDKLKANIITFDCVKDDNELVKSVQQYLQDNQLPMQLCLVPHPRLSGLNWPAGLDTYQGTIRESDLSVVTMATAAIAESGSVVMLSGPETPTEANFLPDNFICIVRAQDLLAHMEDLWTRLREQHDRPPAVVNIISGPSRTADVEQTIQLGAHGPRRMHVIISE